MRIRVWLVVGCFLGALVPVSAGSASTPVDQQLGAGTRVYFDQAEEEDFLSESYNGGLQVSGPLVPTYDPNGQMCLFPNGGGHFTTAYNPTGADQTEIAQPPSGPMMKPPVGEAEWDQNGNFTGRTIAVPGPFDGGDIPYDGYSPGQPPPASPHYNDNGTYVGCAFDRHSNLFATDLGRSQGSFPPSDNGRLVEYFAPDYTSYCILVGPTSGGIGVHHVDGSGGLRQPGTLAVTTDGTGADHVYVPVAGLGSDMLGHGRVLQITGTPSGAAGCPAPSNMPATPVKVITFIDALASGQPLPQGIARDPKCGCWAVSNVLGSPKAIAFYNDAGQPILTRLPVAPIASGDQELLTPYGIAVTKDGTLYASDIHISCGSLPSESSPASSLSCGPVYPPTPHQGPPGLLDGYGRIVKVTFRQIGPLTVPSAPVTVSTKELGYPVSVTACDPTATLCPSPPSLP